MKKWVCLFSLFTATCLGRNEETVAIREKAKADAPVYAHLVARLIDQYTKMSEVIDCNIQIHENALTADLEKVTVSMQVDPEQLKQKRKLYESKAEAAVALLSSKVRRKVRRAIAQELNLDKIIPAYTQMVHQALTNAFPELDPEDIDIVVTTK